ncbi:MAG TPA: hypothetical protein VGL09_19170 [Methylomirabilota bacterium]|jgi:hypothetical protein
MAGVVLAALVFATGVASHLVFSHVRPSRKPERVLVSFMAAAAIVYPALFLAGPPLAPRAVPPAADFLTGLAALGFLALGYVEFWSLIERSFSLRIVIDTAAAPAPLAADDIASAYGGGRGLGWMMEKRLEDLVGSGMLTVNVGRHSLSGRGRSVARVFRALRSVLGIR